MIIYKEPIDIELIDNRLFVNGKEHPPSVRTLDNMQDVLEGSKLTVQGSLPLYYMYRAVYQHKTLRYDITHLTANLIGSEYTKTYGHYHPPSPDGIAYPEAYQVLSGNARFMLQKKNSDGTMNVIAINAEEKETVIFPPAYGHVSINPTNKDLVLANIVSNSFEGDYSEYKVKRGAAYYYTKEGFVENKNYKIKSFEQLSAGEINKKYNFECKDLLSEFYKNPERFEFLERPGLKF